MAEDRDPTATHAARVERIHGVASERTPTGAPALRWLVPRGTRMAHAARAGDLRALCGGHETEGGVSPPHSAMPWCRPCVDAVEREIQRTLDTDGRIDR